MSDVRIFDAYGNVRVSAAPASSLESNVAAYWAMLQKPGDAWGNAGSHVVLANLYTWHGKEAVDTELEKHVAVERAESARREREFVRGFYAGYGIDVPP